MWVYTQTVNIVMFVYYHNICNITWSPIYFWWMMFKMEVDETHSFLFLIKTSRAARDFVRVLIMYLSTYLDVLLNPYRKSIFLDWSLEKGQWDDATVEFSVTKPDASWSSNRHGGWIRQQGMRHINIPGIFTESLCAGFGNAKYNRKATKPVPWSYWITIIHIYCMRVFCGKYVTNIV